MGKSDELCSKGSPFRSSYDNCVTCIADNTSKGNDSVQDYVDPQFKQFVDYCNRSDLSTSSTDVATDVVLVTAVRTQSVTTTSPPSCKICSTMTITGYDGKLVRATIDLEVVTRSFRGEFYQ
jgi:hypothetical protein